ncbi:MAG: serine/threonine protein kinase, partial [Candidatus Binatia bacterium]
MIKPRPYGHYFILEKIAQGGMAEIFKGLTYDFSGLKKFIVIKRILPHIAVNKNFIKMLIDEAKIAVRLSHGNIAQTFDLGKVAEDYFIVMEYVDGKTLSQVFKKSAELKIPIPIPLCAHVAREICHGLDYIHRAKDELGRSLEIVHRDISPQNVIVSDSGNVKIVDFGVAKAAFKLSELERGVLKGKFAYMSPEQTEGYSIDARSDIFSLGVVLWETLSGRRLFKRKSNAETIEAVQHMTVYPPSAYRNEVPSELDDIVMKALERNSENRYPQASDMGLALTKFLLRFYPDFKPHLIGDFLQDIFQDDDNTSDLYQEKTMREELTIR